MATRDYTVATLPGHKYMYFQLTPIEFQEKGLNPGQKTEKFRYKFLVVMVYFSVTFLSGLFILIWHIYARVKLGKSNPFAIICDSQSMSKVSKVGVLCMLLMSNQAT